ncbi:aldehyde dehydrogenase domain-containing protein [Sphaerosporella brunnea]|uniref:aldehyde dehydrogenase (NAD(+)) n=1 Tax=Sphaerosporella brunnea TaxID=1250544 RepID=A0A5J5EWG2_9PEZI|nr:aldehyde dehydrogenase domain-containing protein [Sphaerosporella brunnea]
MAPQNVETRLFINNEFVPGKAGKTFQLINPATEEPTYQVHEATQEDIDLAVKYAKAAQPEWAAKNAAERAAALNALAALIVKPENIDRFAELESVSMGIPKGHYAFQAIISSQFLQHAAGVSLDIKGETSLRTAGRLDLILKQPFGVCGLIIPWNTPLMLACASLGSALATGNVVIMKSSEKAPLTSVYLAQLIKETGLFPAGVVQIVSGMGPTTGAALAQHMEIRKLGFIGSVNTGRKIKEMAAKSNMKNVTCELGGKSPIVVFDDADLAKAAMDAALSISLFSGQACIASSRVYVQDTVREKFVESFKANFKAILSNAGDPLDPATTHGPQADLLQYRHVMGFIERAKADGIAPGMGGNRVGEKGFYIEPTIFFDVPETHDLVKNEIFGPVVVINTFKDEDEALAKANDSEYGLYASVFTKDISRALKFAKGMEAGSIGVNCASPTVSVDMPFGGFKQSGDGRQWGRAGLESWLETKSVFINL